MRYAMSGHPDGLPSRRELASEYEKLVCRAHRALNRLLRIDEESARRGWSRQNVFE